MMVAPVNGIDADLIFFRNSMTHTTYLLFAASLTAPAQVIYNVIEQPL